MPWFIHGLCYALVQYSGKSWPSRCWGPSPRGFVDVRMHLLGFFLLFLNSVPVGEFHFSTNGSRSVDQNDSEWSKCSHEIPMFYDFVQQKISLFSFQWTGPWASSSSSDNSMLSHLRSGSLLYLRWDLELSQHAALNGSAEPSLCQTEHVKSNKELSSICTSSP